MQRLRGYGLRLAAQLAIPGALRDADPCGVPPDVTVTLGEPDALQPAPLYRRTADGLIFTCPGVGAYAIAPHAIRVTPQCGAASDAVSAMLVATALPALLWMRGRFVLHAAAAVLPGASAAIAIAGGSGSGKSTILAQLAAAGAAVVADDSIAFDPACPGVAHGLAGGWFLGDGARSFTTASRVVEGAPVAALFVLTERAANAPDSVRLDLLAATTALLQHRHRPKIPRILRRDAQGLRDVALLAGQFPLYSWRRNVGTPRLTPDEWAMLERAGQGECDQ